MSQATKVANSPRIPTGQTAGYRCEITPSKKNEAIKISL